jgi:hypothetical protein
MLNQTIHPSGVFNGHDRILVELIEPPRQKLSSSLSRGR